MFPLDGSQIETVQRQYNYLKGKSKSLVKWTKLVFHNSEEKKRGVDFYLFSETVEWKLQGSCMHFLAYGCSHAPR